MVVLECVDLIIMCVIHLLASGVYEKRSLEVNKPPEPETIISPNFELVRWYERRTSPRGSKNVGV